LKPKLVVERFPHGRTEERGGETGDAAGEGEAVPRRKLRPDAPQAHGARDHEAQEHQANGRRQKGAEAAMGAEERAHAGEVVRENADQVVGQPEGQQS